MSMSAREEVLTDGLVDWVALQRAHRRVADENAGKPVAIIQDKTLELIRTLVTEGMFEVGELDDDCRFVTWNVPLDESIQRIRAVYTTKFDDDKEWWFYCWLNLTGKGQRVAEAIEAGAGGES